MLCKLCGGAGDENTKDGLKLFDSGLMNIYAN